MKCPVCDDVRMREVEKDGVTIDVCPDCKGVWLDRGELEKLMSGVRSMRQELERMEQPEGVAAAAPGAQYGSAPVAEAPQSYGGPDRVYGKPEELEQPSAQPAFAPHAGAAGASPQQVYAMPVPPQYGSHRSSYDYGYKSGYDKHGYPYKKKKTVLDVFGDLFD